MGTKILPSKTSNKGKFKLKVVAWARKNSIAHWIAYAFAIAAFVHLLGLYSPEIAEFIPDALLAKGLGVLCATIFAALFIYAEVNAPDDDPPVLRSEFTDVVSRLSSELEEKSRTADTLRSDLDKTQEKLENALTKPPQRDLYLTTPRLFGDDVYLVQSKLFQLGYLVQDEITRIYDDATEKAVRQFQVNKSLKEDGIAGPNTRRALDENLEKA